MHLFHLFESFHKTFEAVYWWWYEICEFVWKQNKWTKRRGNIHNLTGQGERDCEKQPGKGVCYLSIFRPSRSSLYTRLCNNDDIENVQETPSVFNRECPELQNMEFLNFFFCFCGSGSATLLATKKNGIWIQLQEADRNIFCYPLNRKVRTYQCWGSGSACFWASRVRIH